MLSYLTALALVRLSTAVRMRKTFMVASLGRTSCRQAGAGEIT